MVIVIAVLLLLILIWLVMLTKDAINHLRARCTKNTKPADKMEEP